MNGLFSKVALLLTGSLALGAAGTYVGRDITGLVPIIGLAVAFIVGMIITMVVARANTGAGILCLAGWTFVSGLFLGPCINQYVKELGMETVFLVYLGTGGVMAICGLIGAFSGKDWGGMERFLMIGLFGLIIAGFVNIFFSFSSGVNIVYSLIGMAIFAGFFIVDFWRVAKGEDNWTNAIDLTIAIYLDYVNFLLYALKFIAEVMAKSKK